VGTGTLGITGGRRTRTSGNRRSARRGSTRGSRTCARIFPTRSRRRSAAPQAVVFAGGLSIRTLTRSARGSWDSPGQKARRNGSFLSQGWGSFLSLPESKLERRGRERLVRCVTCGYDDHPDSNAAKAFSVPGTEAAPVRRLPVQTADQTLSSKGELAGRRPRPLRKDVK
jgi:hypothetical protein